MTVKDTKDTLKPQKDLDQLACWARKWGMRFHPVKRIVAYASSEGSPDFQETDQKDPCFIYSRGNGLRKCRKNHVSWGHYHM